MEKDPFSAKNQTL